MLRMLTIVLFSLSSSASLGQNVAPGTFSSASKVYRCADEGSLYYLAPDHAAREKILLRGCRTVSG